MGKRAIEAHDDFNTVIALPTAVSVAGRVKRFDAERGRHVPACVAGSQQIVNGRTCKVECGIDRPVSFMM